MMETTKISTKMNLEDHFLMHYGTGNKAIVVHPNWFVNQFNETTSERRINVETINHCKKKPNIKIQLQKNEMSRIKKMSESENSFKPIYYIKQIETSVRKGFFFTGPDNKRSQHGMVKFLGLERNRKTRYLTNEWIDLNFKTRAPLFYNKLKNLPVDTEHSGSSHCNR